MKNLDNAYYVGNGTERMIFKAGTNAENFDAAAKHGQPQQFPLDTPDALADESLSSAQAAKLILKPYNGQGVTEVANGLLDLGYEIDRPLSDGIAFKDGSIFRYVQWTM